MTREGHIQYLMSTYTVREILEMLVDEQSVPQDASVEYYEDYKERAITFYETPAARFSRKLGDWWQEKTGG